MNNLSNVVAFDNSDITIFEHIEMFINLKLEHSNSNNTENSYKNDIKAFYDWKVGSFNDYDELIKLTKHDIELSKIDIMKYRTYLITELKNVAGTVNRKISTVKKLYEHFKSVDVTDGMNAFKNIGNIKGKDNSYGAFLPHEVQEIAEYLKNKHTGRGRQLNLTKSNLVLFATQTGLRLESILNLKLDDFVKAEHSVIVYAVDKNKQSRKCKIDFEFYNDLLEMHEIEGKEKEQMFNISVSGVNKMMEDVREHFNFPKHRNLVFHSFRKTGAKHVHKITGNDLRKTQQFTGHKDLNMLQRYVVDEIDMEDYGFVTTSRGVNDNLYKEVSHDKLLEAIDQLDDSQKLMINIILGKLN